MSGWFATRLALAGAAITGLLVAPAVLALSLHSPAFNNGERIPTRYGCDGAGVSPPLTIAAAPDGTQSLALTVKDPDAPSGTFVHWVVYNLPADTRSLASAATGERFPARAMTAQNSYGETGYGALCPPHGRHHYVLTAYALDARLDADTVNARSLAQALRGHELGSARLTGIYGRQAEAAPTTTSNSHE